ncbi:MAG: DUF4446 family protein [Lachnospiraceae bacterium]|jgi:hypothetical protein
MVEFFSGNTLYIIILVLGAMSAALLALVIVLFVNAYREKKRLDRLLEGQDGVNLEEVIFDKFRRLKILEEKDVIEDEAIRDLYLRHEGAFQKMGMIRYDAFSENGGKLSFAFTLLDENNNGIILNVMNGRDGSYCYIKEIERGNSRLTLGKEEALSLKRAIANER